MNLKNFIKKRINELRHRDLLSIHKSFKGDDTNWTISLDDTVLLDKIIKKHKVKTVLELGTGVGAGTFGLAWSLPVDGRIDTVENMRNCFHAAQNNIPSDFKKKVRFHFSPTELTMPFPRINTIAFKDVPKGNWDLIVIDGPSFHFEGKDFITSLPRGDIFTLMPTLPVGALIYIDGSLPTVKLLKRFYGHTLAHDGMVFRKISRDEPRDGKYEKLKSWGFFDEKRV